jgi:hypothetical protein
VNDKVIVIRGELNWAKVIGRARPYTGNPKYDKGPYWSVDVTPDKASRALIKKFDFAEKLRKPREKDIQKESYLSLKVLENRADGEKNNPPKVVDVRNNAWGDKLLGNGTIADVKVKVKDYGSGSEKGVYLQAIRVLSHVPYEVEEFDTLDEDDEFFAGTDDDFAEDADATPDKASKVIDEDLDDDVPF